jgi:hypothetical protein
LCTSRKLSMRPWRDFLRIIDRENRSPRCCIAPHAVSKHSQAWPHAAQRDGRPRLLQRCTGRMPREHRKIFARLVKADIATIRASESSSRTSHTTSYRRTSSSLASLLRCASLSAASVPTARRAAPMVR